MLVVSSLEESIWVVRASAIDRCRILANSDDFEEEDNKRCCQVVEYLRRVAVVIGTEENEVVGLPAMMATAATGANLCRLRGLVETMYLYFHHHPQRWCGAKRIPWAGANVLCNPKHHRFH